MKTGVYFFMVDARYNFWEVYEGEGKSLIKDDSYRIRDMSLHSFVSNTWEGCDTMAMIMSHNI